MQNKNGKGHLTIVGGGCDHKCIDLPIGYKCACDSGFELVGNTTCVGKSYMAHVIFIVICMNLYIFGLYLDFNLGQIFQILMNVKSLEAVLKFVSIGKEGSNVIVSMVIRRTHMILLDAGKNQSWYQIYDN